MSVVKPADECGGREEAGEGADGGRSGGYWGCTCVTCCEAERRWPWCDLIGQEQSNKHEYIDSTLGEAGVSRVGAVLRSAAVNPSTH
jgi:hypothetical protein